MMVNVKEHMSMSVLTSVDVQTCGAGCYWERKIMHAPFLSKISC